ncbi:MAG: hypothetical protein NUV70_07155 [Caldiserica bacterium]|jgi:hypothetical protein|nr:hypothetical protein [Caldisericota bacterium]
MRARDIKPGFFLNEYLAACSPHARLLFIGLWMLADREGRLEDRPKQIEASIFPYEKVNIEKLLKELENVPGDHPFIKRYEVNRKRYIQVVNFKKHQNPHRNEKESSIPAPQEEEEETQEITRVTPEMDRATREMERVTQEITRAPREMERVTPEISRATPADSLTPDSLTPDILTPDSLIADSLKEASPKGEAQRPLRAPPPQEGEKRTPETASRKEKASREVPPQTGEPSLSASSLWAEKALSEVPPPDVDAPLSGLLLQAEKAPLGGAPTQPEDSPLSVQPLQPEEASLEVPPLQDSALGTSPPEGGSPRESAGAPEQEEFPQSAKSERTRKTAPHSEEVPLEVPSPQLARAQLRKEVPQRASYPQPAWSLETGSPAQPVKASPLVKMERSLRSPPHPEKARRSMRSPPHPAVEAYKKAFFYYPRRNLYSLIAEKVGDDEEDLRLWAKACQSWAAHGWNPRNIAGLLEYYEKRGFEEKSTISRGIPKFSRAAQIAIELAEKYEREEGNEEDQGEKEDISLEEGNQGISAFFKKGAPSPFSHPP